MDSFHNETMGGVPVGNLDKLRADMKKLDADNKKRNEQKLLVDDEHLKYARALESFVQRDTTAGQLTRRTENRGGYYYFSKVVEVGLTGNETVVMGKLKAGNLMDLVRLEETLPMSAEGDVVVIDRKTIDGGILRVRVIDAGKFKKEILTEPQPGRRGMLNKVSLTPGVTKFDSGAWGEHKEALVASGGTEIQKHVALSEALYNSVRPIMVELDNPNKPKS